MTIALNTKILEVNIKIPNITNLANTAAPTAVENKTPNVVNLVKKTDYNTKLVKLKKKIIIIMLNLIMINILLQKNLISQHQKILLQD